MFTLIRKNQQVLMIIVTVLVIIAFAWLYNSTDLDKLSQGNVGKMYGKDLTVIEFQRRGRMLGLTSSLGFQDLIRGLSAAANSEQDLILNGIILDHQADALQIQPTEAEVATVLRTLPVFQENGQFNFGKYGKFIEESLAPNGFTEQQLSDAVKMQIRYNTLRALVDSGTIVPDSEAREYWNKGNSNLHSQIIRINKETFAADVTVSDKDVTTFYDNRKDTLNTEEERQLDFVRLDLAEEQKKLEGSERIKQLQDLANKAAEFAAKMLEEGSSFKKLASEFDLKVESTSKFTASKPDPIVAASAQLSAAALALTVEAPNSDPLQEGKDGFIVFHLANTVPSRTLTLDEAREDIIAEIKEERIREAMEANAGELRTKLIASMEAGESFIDAAIAAGVEATPLPAFSLSKPDMQMPDWMPIAQQIMDLEEGDVSELFMIADGGALLHVSKIDPGTDADFNTVKDAFVSRLRSQKQQLAWSEWISASRKQAGMTFAQ